MGRKNLQDYHDLGVKFYEYLKDTQRNEICERGTLHRIYREFISPGYGFSSVLYALKYFGKVKVINGQRIIFTKKLQNMKCIGEERADKGTQDCEMINRHESVAGQIKIYCPEHQFKPDKKMSLSLDIYSEHSVNLLMKNTGTEKVRFTGYKALHSSLNISLEEKINVTKENPVVLLKGADYEVCTVKFTAREVGVLSVKLSFEFELERSFQIERFIEAQCVTALSKELAPTAPYRPRLIIASNAPSKFIPVEEGQPPVGQSRFSLLDIKLKKSLNGIFRELQNAASQDERKKILESPLSSENYAQKFRLLLELERYQMETDLKKCNVPNENQQEVTLHKFNKDILVAKIPSIMEHRVTLLRGDCLLVCPTKNTSKKYRLYVDSVHQDTVRLGYNRKFLSVFEKGMKVYIEFILNSLTIAIQRRAVTLAVKTELDHVLFPTSHHSSTSQGTLSDLKLFDRKLEENPEQYQAVQHIVFGSSKPAPYLVFGPPGTGKTVTVAEAIKQILKLQPKSHILACAPTNSAVDQLCINILEHVDRSEVLRIYAKYLNPADVRSKLKECSNLNGDVFDFPKDYKEELQKFRVIITTLHTSSRLVTANIPYGHFTHVFVDEAGHAVETECLLPLAGLLNPHVGQVVLAGDPQQLGPIIKSPFARNFGFGLSLLERLMTNFRLYQKTNDVFDKRFVTKLLRNYRSHPAILEIPNKLFYDGELKPFADEYQRNSYSKWEHLPQMDFPIIFHEVTSLEFRESSCPSFFNVAEVEVLMDYVKKLLQTQAKKGHSKLCPHDIGIITPYWKQVQKIRLALGKVEEDYNGISSIKVGSVEEFQGQERRVILVSTVRSNPEYTECNLGFVRNEKRFNVAVTRAKDLLIIVGNSLVLRSDPSWAQYIDYCKEKGGYRHL